MYKNILFMLLFFIASPAFAGFDEGVAAYNKGDYSAALQELKPLAEQGNADAQFLLGEVYFDNKSNVFNKDTAIQWFKKAAEKGGVELRLKVARKLRNDADTTNKLFATELYVDVAVHGNVDMQLKIADELRADSEPMNRYLVSKMYQNNYAQANADEQLKAAWFFSGANRPKQENALALDIFRKLAEQGNVEAQFGLGFVYANGRGVAKDEVAAVQWYRKAAEQGDANAQVHMGFMYVKGQGVAKDEAQAVQWYRKAAEQGSAGAQYFLGFAYSRGYGLSKDEVQAVQWYRKAAEQGDADAQFNLGLMYANGLGVTKDLEKAQQLYTLSAKQGNEPAKNNLADLQQKLPCLHKASTLLFGEALNCTDKTALRLASKQAGANETREDDGYWYDLYDSSALLEGTSKLSIAYSNDKFAEAVYQFDSSMDTHKVVEVRNMVVSKYGKPATSEGNPSLGPVSYIWKLKDGIRLVVQRDWPDTTVYLKYIHPANYAAMEAEQERQKRAEEDGKRSKQSKAF